MTCSIEPTAAANWNRLGAFGSSSRRRVAMMLVMTAVWQTALPVSAAPRQSAAPTTVNADGIPDGLAASDWSSIRAAYEANRHAAFAVEGGYQARNPGQAWRTNFDGRGFENTPDAGEWSWGLELVSFGREGAERTLQDVAPVSNRCNQRVEYQWGDELTEWYINDQRGLEHGYTVHERPVCRNELARRAHDGCQRLQPLEGAFGVAPPGGRTNLGGCAQSQPLRFTLAVRGDLIPHVSGDGHNVSFVDTNGAAVVNYSDLIVLDATGRTLPARFEVGDFNSAFSILHSQFVHFVVDDSNAVYPLTIDPIAQQAYLKASNTGVEDTFGVSVAVSGDTVVVGAPSEDSNATGVDGNDADNSALGSGAAYVFVRSGGVWSQQAYLKASNTGAEDSFGVSVAVSGDTVVVGARSEDSNATGVDGANNNLAQNSGAAYVFVRSGMTWTQQAYLKASNTGMDDGFGRSVAANGDTVVVGASGEASNATGVNGNEADNSALGSGAAYVFVRNGGVWSQQSYLKASNTGAQDQFGYSVSVSGDTVVVGAFGEDSNATGVNGNGADNSAANSGAAYVFVRSGVVWSQQAYVKGSNTQAGDGIGWSVSASNETVLVGAISEDSNATGVNGNEANNSAGSSGAAYVFVRSGGNWSQQAYLKASNTGIGDQFGFSVSLSGDTVVVAANNEDSNTTGVNGNGANNSYADSGAAYVFVRSGTAWSQQAYLKASNTGPGDQFGYSVSVSGDAVVVGAAWEASNATGVNGNQADNSATLSGAAYIFTTGVEPDGDGDGVPDLTDNCPQLANPTQADSDGDGKGDSCDNCPLNANPTQANGDGDGMGDVCDLCPVVAAMLGDVNGSLAVNTGDIDRFSEVLLDPGSATAAELCAADTNSDLSVDGRDVPSFVDLLLP